MRPTPENFDWRRRYGIARGWQRMVFWMGLLFAWGLALSVLGVKGAPLWSLPYPIAVWVAFVYAEVNRKQWAKRSKSG